jgi:hypothetical protein
MEHNKKVKGSLKAREVGINRFVIGKNILLEIYQQKCTNVE